MEFCPKCGKLMLPQRMGEEINLVCTACGHVSGEVEDYRIVRTVEREEKPTIMGEVPKTLPTTRARCPSCGNNGAYWWMRQTRGADEPSTRFYRCAKCGHTWREYT